MDRRAFIQSAAATTVATSFTHLVPPAAGGGKLVAVGDSFVSGALRVDALHLTQEGARLFNEAIGATLMRYEASGSFDGEATSPPTPPTPWR